MRGAGQRLVTLSGKAKKGRVDEGVPTEVIQ